MEFKLIIKKLNNTITQKESKVFDVWYNKSKDHQEYFNRVKNNYDERIDFVDVEKGWEKLNEKLSQREQVERKKAPYWKYAVAASIALLVTFNYFYNGDKLFGGHTEPIAVENNIEIGTDKATLILEDGEQIELEKGQEYANKSVKSDGENLIYNNEDLEEDDVITYNYLSIPRGGQFEVQLADGTNVWLNSESKLKYPVNFQEGKPREVELLYGEAYFDVSPSIMHNGSEFKVITETQDIVVLGTEFNINSYKNNDVVYTTLVEGSVVIRNGVSSKVLAPGQQSINNIKNNHLEVREVDVSYYTAWKNGFFMFDKESLEDMMNNLSRWYDINVVFEDEDKRDIIFSGLLNRDDSINELLNYLEKTNEVEFEITDNTIIVK